MNTTPAAPARRWPLSRRATITVAIIYLLVAALLWWNYPASPRLVIRAGPLAQFAGISPDGQWLITADQPDVSKSTVGGPLHTRFWNLHTGRPGIVLGAMPGTPLIFTPDGKRFSIGDFYYDAATGKVLPEKRPRNRLSGLPPIVSPDGKLSVQDRNAGMDIVETDTGKSRFTVKSSTIGEFRPDGQELAAALDLVEGDPVTTGRLRYQLKFFDPQTGEEKRALPETDGRVRLMAYSAAGDKVAVILWTGGKNGVYQGAIQIWNLATQQIERSVVLDGEVVGGLHSLQFITDGHVVVASGMFRTLLWDSSAPEPDQLVAPGKLGIFAPIVSADGRLAAWWDNEAHELLVRRLGDGRGEILLRQHLVNPRLAMMPLLITPDGRLIAMVSIPPPTELIDKIVDWFRLRPLGHVVFDIATGQSLGGIPDFPRTTVGATTPDGRTIIMRDFDYKLCDKFSVWDLPAGTPWFMILGGALMPAGLVGWLLWWRQNRRPTAVANDSPT